MTATLSVKLPDGRVASRKSDRPYSHAVIVQQTEAYRAHVLGGIERQIAACEALIARETPRAVSPEDQAAYAAAAARIAYLDEEIEETTLCHDKVERTWSKPRWLSDAFRRENPRVNGRDAIDRAHRELSATARGTIEDTQVKLEGHRHSLAHHSEKIVVGHCYVASWHHSFHLAQKGAEKVRGYNIGCLVSVTCEIEVKQPRARRAAVG